MNETFELKPGTSAEVLKQAEAIKDAYVAEIGKYPNLKVSARLNNPGEWGKWNIQVHSANEVEGDRFHDVLNLQVDATWNHSPTRHLKIERFTSQGGRGSKRHYRKMDTANIRKIAKEASDNERMHVQCAKLRVEAQDTSAQWQAVRKSALKGMAIHPCLAISIVESGAPPTQEDRENLRFAVDVNRYSHNPLNNYRFTLEQIAKIASVISEVTGLDKMFAIIQRNGDKITQWDGTWFQANRNLNAPISAKAFTRAEAEKELARLQAVPKTEDTKEATLEIVTFSQLI